MRRALKSLSIGCVVGVVAACGAGTSPTTKSGGGGAGPAETPAAGTEAPAQGIFLPGTQPNENGIELAKVAQCQLCHAKTPNGDADPFRSWSGGMMAQAARDPVYRSALAIANQDIPGVGEFCVRCHAPRGWLEGRSKKPDGSQLTPEDMHGVSCDVCHRLVDPLSQEAVKYAKDVPPGYGNAMMVADHRNIVRGPYGDGTGAKPHKVMKSAYQGSSELCANCHNVSNPLYAEDVRTQSPHLYGHVERTYSEWKLSAFASRGADGTCQSCHFPKVEGGGQASRYGDLRRDYFVRHGAVGASTWVQRAVAHLFQYRVDAEALDAGAKRALALHRTAAKLEVRFESQDKAVVRVTNLTGHKLPTGYSEGRRMWLAAKFLDKGGQVLGEIGRYGPQADTIRGEEIQAPTLLDPESTRVWEILPGLSPKQASKYGKKPGKSFHFVLNDMVVKDNRIPPEGFRNAAFAEHLDAPVGATYADGQHWDEVPLELPAGTAVVEARLMYQPVSWEYLRFLVEENRTDEWGGKLYRSWLSTGRGAPNEMAKARAER